MEIVKYNEQNREINNKYFIKIMKYNKLFGMIKKELNVLKLTNLLAVCVPKKQFIGKELWR